MLFVPHAEIAGRAGHPDLHMRAGRGRRVAQQRAFAPAKVLLERRARRDHGERAWHVVLQTGNEMAEGGGLFAFGIDTTDTYPVFAEGDYDEETMTFTLYGENLEPNLGRMVPFKFIFDFENEDRYTSEVWFQMEGAPGADEEGWFPVLESVQERAEK